MKLPMQTSAPFANDYCPKLYISAELFLEEASYNWFPEDSTWYRVFSRSIRAWNWSWSIWKRSLVQYTILWWWHRSNPFYYTLDKRSDFIIIAYCDTDHADDLVTRRSITGFIMYLNKLPIQSMTKRQWSVEKPHLMAHNLQYWNIVVSI